MTRFTIYDLRLMMDAAPGWPVGPVRRAKGRNSSAASIWISEISNFKFQISDLKSLIHIP